MFLKVFKPRNGGALLLAAFLGLWVAPPALALDPEKSVTQFTHRSWGAMSGLGAIYGIAQTTDGFLWVGAANGVFKFDGDRFIRWEPKPGEPDLPIAASHLTASRDGSLWLASGEVVIRIQNGHSTLYSARDGLPGKPVTTIYGAPNGTVWVGSQLGMARFQGERWQTMGAADGLPEAGVTTMTTDPAGTLWAVIGTSKNDPPCQFATLRAGQTQFQIQRLAFGVSIQMATAPDGKIWLSEFMRSIRPVERQGNDLKFGRPVILSGPEYFMIDRDGSLWLAAKNLQRVRASILTETNQEQVTDASLENFTRHDGLTSDFINCFFEDREGSVWVGTSGGLDCFSDTKFTSYSEREGMPYDADLELQATSDGRLWASSDWRGFLEIDPAKHTFINRSWLDVKTAGGLLNVNSFYADRDGRVLVGSGLGILSISNDTARPFEAINYNKLKAVLATTRDTNGALWFCDRVAGVYRWFNHELKPVPGGSLADVGEIMSADCDTQGRVWLGSATEGVFCWEAGIWRRYSQSQGLFAGQVTAIVTDAHGQVWAAGYGGFSRFQDDHFQTLNRANGLPVENIGTMILDDNGDFWLGGFDGVYHVTTTNLVEALAHEGGRVAGELFGPADGMRGLIRENRRGWQELGASIATKTPDGRLWFATTEGLTMIDPKNIHRNLVPPPVHIEYFNADGKNYPGFTNLKLSRGVNNYEIGYAGLSYVDPDKVRYKYKLDGFDGQWVEAGTRRQAFYSNLRPGQYRFHVCSCNDDGVWNEEGDSVGFVILPHFYETKWFFGLGLAVVALGLWGLHGLRLRRMAARLNLEYEMRQRERTRVAQELHDTILQGFTGIGLKLDAILGTVPASLNSIREQLKSILEQSDRYLGEARRSIWELRYTSFGEPDDFGKKLAEASERRLAGTGIHLDFSIHGTPRKLTTAVAEHLLRICEEAVTNAVKHAHPIQVQVNVEFKPKELVLLIRDDGGGFDCEKLPPANAGHYGLVGIQERVHAVAGKLAITSRPGEGTEIRVNVRGG